MGTSRSLISETECYDCLRVCKRERAELTHHKNELVSTEKVGNSSVEVFDSPVRNGKTLRNFEIFLPKFHFILPKFHFSPR